MEHCNVCPVLNCAACVNADGSSGSIWSGVVHRGVLSANLRPGSSELAGQGLWRLQFALDRLVTPARFSRVICPVIAAIGESTGALPSVRE
jgi:hypothetical protein